MTTKCCNCGTAFNQVRKVGRPKKYCSTACYKSGNRDTGRSLRARDMGLPTEHISSVLLLERDNWICGICKGPIDKTVDPQSDQGPSVDHIIPLSRGGTHTYANVQAAHRICNGYKSAGFSIGEMPSEIFMGGSGAIFRPFRSLFTHRDSFVKLGGMPSEIIRGVVI